MVERYYEPEQRVTPDFERDPSRKIERDPSLNVESEVDWEVKCLSKQFQNLNCPATCPFYPLARAKVMSESGRSDLKVRVQRELKTRFDPAKCSNQQTLHSVR